MLFLLFILLALLCAPKTHLIFIAHRGYREPVRVIGALEESRSRLNPNMLGALEP